MRTRIRDFYDIENHVPLYSFQVYDVIWKYPIIDGKKIAIFDTAEERDVKRKEFRKIKLTTK